MGIEVKFTATDNCLTEADVIEAAKQAFAEVMAETLPDDEYMQEACTDLAHGRSAPMWMSAGGFAESVAQGIEQRLAQLVFDRRGERGFSSVVTDAVVREVA